VKVISYQKLADSLVSPLWILITST